ncbi:MAG: type II secretion system protein N, partial [Gammaproteobacteria bacterium]|nr:type II secretion system protein N [Gammaproteobacteria bacterium]
MQSISLKSVSDLPLGNLFTKVLPPLVSVVLVITISNNLATLTWDTLPGNTMTPVPVEQARPSQPTASSTTRAVNAGQEISNWHLFGQVVKVAPGPKVVEAPPV